MLVLRWHRIALILTCSIHQKEKQGRQLDNEIWKPSIIYLSIISSFWAHFNIHIMTDQFTSAIYRQIIHECGIVFSFFPSGERQIKEKTISHSWTNCPRIFRFNATAGRSTHKVMLADDVSCSACIFQWRYITGEDCAMWTYNIKAYKVPKYNVIL